RILNADNTPAAGANVELDSVTYSSHLATTTRADGTYRIDVVPSGRYTVSITTADFSRAQWVPHTVRLRNATVLTVQTGKTATANDTLLPTGTLTVAAKDA